MPRQDDKPDTSPDEYPRKSGRWGAEEPPMGRPYGERPNPGKGGKPNPHGPEYEQGGRYPGTQTPGESNGKQTGRSAPTEGQEEPHDRKQKPGPGAE